MTTSVGLLRDKKLSYFLKIKLNIKITMTFLDNINILCSKCLINKWLKVKSGNCIMVIFGTLITQSISQRMLVSLPISPILCDCLTLGNSNPENHESQNC